jgi:hypothetical protein
VGVNTSKLDSYFITATCNQAKVPPHGIAAIFVDDTLRTDNKQYAKAEEHMHRNYDTRRTQIVIKCPQTNFDGMQIGRDLDGTLRIRQQALIKTYQISRQVCKTAYFLYSQRAARCPGSLHAPIPMQTS